MFDSTAFELSGLFAKSSCLCIHFAATAIGISRSRESAGGSHQLIDLLPDFTDDLRRRIRLDEFVECVSSERFKYSSGMTNANNRRHHAHQPLEEIVYRCIAGRAGKNSLAPVHSLIHNLRECCGLACSRRSMEHGDVAGGERKGYCLLLRFIE